MAADGDGSEAIASTNGDGSEAIASANGDGPKATASANEDVLPGNGDLPEYEDFPAGKYACIDPEHVFSKDDWHDLVFRRLRGRSSIVVVCRGVRCFVWTTSKGDGLYPLYKTGGRFAGNVSCNVGLLCIISADKVPEDSSEEEYSVYAIQEPATPEVTDGDVTHGDYEIITSNYIPNDYQTQQIDFDWDTST